MFISFEGIDKSGKSTQVKLLAEFLRGLGYPVVTTREPGGTEVGKKLRAMLLDKYLKMSNRAQVHLFCADRAQHIEEVIGPALRSGKVVITDRYADSTVAYQSYGNFGYLDSTIERLAYNAPTPNLTFIIDIPVEVAIERMRLSSGGYDRYETEPHFIERVRSGFLAIANNYRKKRDIHIIDGNRPQEEVAREISLIFRELMNMPEKREQ